MGAAAVLIGANLPDVDIVGLLGGPSFALDFRRSLTHGILAMVLLPGLLVGALVLWDRWDRSRAERRAASPPARASALILPSFLAVWSHPLLDWLNTSGVRLLAPFSDRWFYGDALFIIDAWVWLGLGAVVALAWPTSRRARVAGLLLAAAMALVVLAPPIPSETVARASGLRLLWALVLAALAAWLGLRSRRAELPGPGRFSARLVLIGFAVYVAFAIVASKLAVGAAQQSLAANGETPAGDVMASPVPLDPSLRRVLATTENGYRVGLWRMRLQPDRTRTAISWQPELVPFPADEPAVRRARTSEGSRGWSRWVRFPVARRQVLEGREMIHLGDLRYLDFVGLREMERSYGSVLVPAEPVKPADP